MRRNGSDRKLKFRPVDYTKRGKHGAYKYGYIDVCQVCGKRHKNIRAGELKYKWWENHYVEHMLAGDISITGFKLVCIHFQKWRFLIGD